MKYFLYNPLANNGIKPELYALSTLIFLFVSVILLISNHIAGKSEKELKKKKGYFSIVMLFN